MPELSLDDVTKHASYEQFQVREVFMSTQYGKFWINQANLRSLKQGSPLVQIHDQVMAQLKNIADSFSKCILDKFHSYYLRKDSIPFANPIEKNLNDEAMDAMALIYSRTMMNPLLDEVSKINAFGSKVQNHLNQFKTISSAAEDTQAKDNATALIKDLHVVRRELNLFLFSLVCKVQQLQAKVQSLTEQGERIGPAFKANPVMFLIGGALLLPKNSGLTGQPVEKVVSIIERIKQTRSVAQGAEPFYLLFLNAIQAMRKMEKGMAFCLAKQFKVKHGFELVNGSNDPLMHSDRNLSLKTFNSSKESFSFIWETMAPEAAAKPQEVVESPFLTKVKSHLTCPLSKVLFKEPVIIETGYSFERKHLEEYFKTNDTCPVTKKKLTSKTFFRNLQLKSIANRFETSKKGDQLTFFDKEIIEFNSSISYERWSEHVIVASSGVSYEMEEFNKIMASDEKKCYLTNLILDPNIKILNQNLIDIMRTVSQKGKEEMKD